MLPIRLAGGSRFARVNNVFNESTELLRYSSETPSYARQNRTQEFGAGISLGIKGYI